MTNTLGNEMDEVTSKGITPPSFALLLRQRHIVMRKPKINKTFIMFKVFQTITYYFSEIYYGVTTQCLLH